MSINRKGIILSGGLGTRLYPLSNVTSKQLLPVYDKPMIYYSLSTLLLAGIRDIMIITSPFAFSQYRDLMGDGSTWGINLSYKIQESPNGIAEALILAEDFIAGGPSALILGDNIFFGNGLTSLLQKAAERESGATIFSYHVSDPQRFGIVTVDKDGKAKSIDEKPAQPKSNFAVTGLYFYDSDVVDVAKSIEPSDRGELEITAVNQVYLDREKLYVQPLHRGFVWFDTGTVDSLMDASEFIRQIEKRQGQKISCPEEISLNKGWITPDNVEQQIRARKDNSYDDYLRMIISDYRNTDA